MSLPEQYQNEWFVRSNVESLNAGMALYHTESDRFYTVFQCVTYTVYLTPLDNGDRVSDSVQDIEESLQDTWIPVEVRA
jgi:hypothetical protein